jgi:hypothetical protein
MSPKTLAIAKRSTVWVKPLISGGKALGKTVGNLMREINQLQ